MAFLSKISDRDFTVLHLGKVYKLKSTMLLGMWRPAICQLQSFCHCWQCCKLQVILSFLAPASFFETLHSEITTKEERSEWKGQVLPWWVGQEAKVALVDFDHMNNILQFLDISRTTSTLLLSQSKQQCLPWPLCILLTSLFKPSWASGYHISAFDTVNRGWPG